MAPSWGGTDPQSPWLSACTRAPLQVRTMCSVNRSTCARPAATPHPYSTPVPLVLLHLNPQGHSTPEGGFARQGAELGQGVRPHVTGTSKELTGEGEAAVARQWKHAQRSGGRAGGWSHAVGRGVHAAERWESGEEEAANPAQERGGCRKGISWLRVVHGELQAGLSLSDYWSRERGSGLRQVWQEEGYRSWRERQSRRENGGQRGEGGTWERGEQRGAPSPGSGWRSHGVDEVGMGLVRHTSPPAPTWLQPGGSTICQNQLSAQGVTNQPLRSLPPEGQRRASSFVAS